MLCDLTYFSTQIGSCLALSGDTKLRNVLLILSFTHIRKKFVDPFLLFFTWCGPDDTIEVVFQIRVAEFSTRVAAVHSDKNFVESLRFNGVYHSKLAA